MAINVYQAYAGQSIRTSSVGESSGKSGRTNGEIAPVSKVDASTAANVANTLGTPSPESGLEAVAMASVDPVQMTRAVEQANAVSETAMRARNRSVQFGFDTQSGRVTMTITEELNGEEVTRQIPPREFLNMVERLQGYSEGESLPKGSIFNLDG